MLLKKPNTSGKYGKQISTLTSSSWLVDLDQRLNLKRNLKSRVRNQQFDKFSLWKWAG